LSRHTSFELFDGDLIRFEMLLDHFECTLECLGQFV
jgi:hypothetical protein